MLRIGITCYPTHGGSGVVATELGKLLAERGHSIHFITYDMPFRIVDFHENMHYHEVKAHSYDVFKYPPYDLALAGKMAHVAKMHHLDILHVHYAVPHAIAAILAKQMVYPSNLKVISTLHGTDITILGEDPALKEMIRYGIEKSDVVTGVSDALIEQTYALFQVTKPIERIYNFVDERVYFPKPGSVKKADPEEKIVLHISNFRRVKRVKDVIAIFERVQRVCPSKLLLVGEGPELKEAMELVEKLSLSSKVIFLGYQNDVADLIASADILLLPSSQESFGLVAIEAMASGVPVVASNVGGLSEVIEHGVTGFLSDVGDIDAMARDTITLFQHQELYRCFSRSGRRRVIEHFSGKVMVRKYEELYYRALIERGSMSSKHPF